MGHQCVSSLFRLLVKKTVNQWNSVPSWPASPSLGSPAVQPVELPFKACSGDGAHGARIR